MCLEIVNQYIYLGILLTDHLGYTKMANHVSKAASRALEFVIAKNKSFGGLPFGSFQKLFDSMVWSVISYGAANLGNRQFSCINLVQLRALRYYMGVGRYTPNSAVHDDTVWKQTLVRQWLFVTSQWLRLKNMDTNRFGKYLSGGNGMVMDEPGVTNSRMLKATLSDYLFQTFVNS